MRNPLAQTWRNFRMHMALVTSGSEGVATLIYRNASTGEDAQWTVPIPCSPELLRLVDATFARTGFVRVEDKPS